jgi:poly(3-hydroxybutyrate) depolymerase
MLALILPLCVALGASATGSAGCGTNPPDSGSYTIRSGGLTRKYIVNVPSAYDEDVAAPLILSFHGNGKTAASQEDLSDFDDEGWNPDAISVYPQGVKASVLRPSETKIYIRHYSIAHPGQVAGHPVLGPQDRRHRVC